MASCLDIETVIVNHEHPYIFVNIHSSMSKKHIILMVVSFIYITVQYILTFMALNNYFFNSIVFGVTISY